jgi:phage tail-like protein
VDAARRDGSIVIKDSLGQPVASWDFRAGWPSKWTGAELDAGSNEVATEKLVITHEGLSRV